MSSKPRPAYLRRLHYVRRLSGGVMIAAVSLFALSLAGCSPSTDTHAQGTGTVGTATATATAPASGGTASPSATASGYPVQVYFSRHPESDSNPANVFPVSRVSPDLGVATYALRQLIAGPTASETAAQYYTPLTSSLTGASNCGGADFTIALNMRASVAETGTATVQFCRTTQLAGDLSGAYIRAEIEKTLLQFPTIHKVVILTHDGGCFDDFSGQNLCLK